MVLRNRIEVRAGGVAALDELGIVIAPCTDPPPFGGLLSLMSDGLHDLGYGSS
jgi:hypothetical protein